jgi:hypothetical protein
MAPVGKCLPKKHKALSSNSQYYKKKKKERESYVHTKTYTDIYCSFIHNSQKIKK